MDEGECRWVLVCRRTRFAFLLFIPEFSSLAARPSTGAREGLKSHNSLTPSIMPPTGRRGGHAAAAAAADAVAAAPMAARPAADVSALAAIAAGLAPGTRLTRDELARFRGRVGDYAAVR